MTKPTMYSAYNHPPKVRLDFKDKKGNPTPSRTKQAFKEEADINNIIKKYDKTGVLTSVNKAIAQYGDFTEQHEYSDSLNFVTNAQNNFMELPSSLRRRFGDSPDEYCEFVSNPANNAEMITLGLATPDLSAPTSIETAPTSTPETSEETS